MTPMNRGMSIGTNELLGAAYRKVLKKADTSEMKTKIYIYILREYVYRLPSKI